MPSITSANGHAAGVTTGSRVTTSDVTRTTAEATAIESGQAFCCSSIVTPTADADVFVRIANTSSDDLIVTKVTASAASAETIALQTTINYTSGGTHADLVATNRLAGSSNLFTVKGTFEGDVNITGDAGSVVIGHLGCGVAETQYTLDLHGSEIVIPSGYSLLLESITGAVALTTDVYCHFDVTPRADA